jgi:hypothetical protein
MATSTIPALKANLRTQLAARGGLTGVQISYGAPLPATQREFIWLGDVNGEQEYGTYAAPNARHEQYTLELILSVLKEGVDAKAADDRCFVLFGEVETQVRGDPTISGAVAESHLGLFRLTEWTAPDGMNRSAQLIAELNCQAWI